MIKKTDKVIPCGNCGRSFSQDDLERQCSNCFACTGCEIYQCPACSAEIVERPVGSPQKSRNLRNDNDL